MKPFDIRPKAALLWLVGFVAAIGGGLAWITSFYEWMFPAGDLWNARSVASLAAVLLIVLFLLMHDLFRREFEKRVRAEDRAKDFEDKLILSEQARLMDVTTGIPNSELFKTDIASFFKKRNSSVKQAHAILIDLHGFKKLNDRYGHFKADQLLRNIAQRIYPGMRRNEDMYKQLPPDEAMYRMYPGGDEFIFLIEGDLVGALGFVKRLQDLFVRIAPEATRQTLGEAIPLAFLCAVVPVEKGDVYDSVKQRLSDCYTRATNGKRPFSICWHPGLSQSNVPEKLYGEIKELFSITTADAGTEDAD